MKGFNGLNNVIYLTVVMVMLIIFAVIFSLGDIIMNFLNAQLFMNPTSAMMFTSWINVRDFFVALCFNIALPFIIFTSFLSSFINRNQNLLSYIIQCFVLLMIIPLIMYGFAGYLTTLANIPWIDPAYLQSLYLSNFLTILVVNMMLSIASFVFVMKGVSNVT